MLETERLLLRPPTPKDLDGLERIFGDREVMRFIRSGAPLTREQISGMLERMIARFEADGFGQLVVEEREGSRLVGRVGLLPHDPETWQLGSRDEIGETAEIEIGWALAREAWGNGYGLEAAAAVRDWARDELGLQRLVSIIQHGNARSVRIAKKLGLDFEREIVTSFEKQAHLYSMTL
jgi:RimJ/RimL family protein N-acetyltransferase